LIEWYNPGKLSKVDETTLAGDGGHCESLYGDELSVGAMAGEYVIQALLAAGGCGTVYSAVHRILGRRAAIKVLHRELSGSPEMLERFIREARAVNLIGHPNIVDIYEFGELNDGRPYYVMELLEGSDLESLIRRRGRLSPSEAFELLQPVCLALEAAHAAGVIHRDLKASNIAVHESSGKRVVKLLDFGIAKLVRPDGASSGLTSVGNRVGTPSAMAPEQILGGAVDARTDVYALGVLLYHLLTGRFPFESDDPVELDRLHLEAPPPRTGAQVAVDPAVDALVARCLEKAPERRFESVSAFLEAFRSAIDVRPQGTATLRRAVALLVELRFDPAVREPMDDALLDDATAVLDLAEQALRDAGFVLAVATGTALLGVSMLPDDAVGDVQGRERALHLAEALHRRLTGRPGADSRLSVRVCVHADRVSVFPGTDTSELAGDLLRLGSWGMRDVTTAPCATAAAVENLSSGLPDGLVVLSR